MNYGRAIRLVRSARRLSQKELADKLNLDASLVSHLENNTRQPSSATQRQLAKALDMPLYLLVLLASDAEDLDGGLPPAQAQLFGLELLRLMAGPGVEAKTPRKRKR